MDRDEAMQKLRSLGLTFAEIGRRFGVSEVTVYRHVTPGALEKHIKSTKRFYREHPGSRKDIDQKYQRIHPEQYRANQLKNQLKYIHKIRREVVAMLGDRCSNCGETDWRVLQINHLIDGDGVRDRRKYGRAGTPFYNAILRGEKDTKDLNLLCSNCNALYEHQKGKRSKDNQGPELHNRVISMLGGACVKCGNDDLRVLQVNHINGGGKAELKKTGAINLYKMILRGERSTENLNVMCGNCNILYSYELEDASEERNVLIRPSLLEGHITIPARPGVLPEFT